MMGRDRRNGRANLKTRVGIATAVLVGGGAIGIAAVAASSGHGTSSAASAGFSRHFNGTTTAWNQLNSAMNSWSNNQQSTYNTLAGMTSQRTFNQYWSHNKMLAVQRGIVMLATRKFIILQSANGHLSLWLTSGNTHFQNVANSTAGTAALTANRAATQAAMQSSNMIPATTLLAGSPLTAAQALTPTTVPTTITIQVAGTNLTVTVTITRTTAAVSQTATAPWNGNPTWNPTTMTQNIFTTATNTTKLARGDLALIAGVRSHNLLHAQLVLFTPLTTADVGGVAGTGIMPTTPTPTVGASMGTHF